jgi:hypothetical protein
VKQFKGSALLLATLIAAEVATTANIPGRHQRTERHGQVPLAVTPIHVSPPKVKRASRAQRKAEKASRGRS